MQPSANTNNWYLCILNRDFREAGLGQKRARQALRKRKRSTQDEAGISDINPWPLLLREFHGQAGATFVMVARGNMSLMTCSPVMICVKGEPGITA